MTPQEESQKKMMLMNELVVENSINKLKDILSGLEMIDSSNMMEVDQVLIGQSISSISSALEALQNYQAEESVII